MGIRPLVIIDSNKIGRLPTEDPVDGANISSVTVHLGDISSVTASGSWDFLVEFDSGLVSEIEITSLHLMAPLVDQAPAATGTSTVQVNVEDDYSGDGDTVSLTNVQNSVLKSVSIPIDVAGGQKLYVRKQAIGDHLNTSLIINYKATTLP